MPRRFVVLVAFIACLTLGGADAVVAAVQQTADQAQTQQESGKSKTKRHAKKAARKGKQAAKSSGTSAKNAAKDTGHAVKEGAKKAGHEAKEGAQAVGTTGKKAARAAKGSTTTAPDSNATARCNDGSWSHSQHRAGTCSGHGGVKSWVCPGPLCK